MTRLELIRATGEKRRQPAAGEVLEARLEDRAVLVAPKRKPHAMQRTPSCSRCRAGWELAYGRHTVRRSSAGLAWCEECRWFVPYREERFAPHFARGISRHRKSCSGSGQPIPAWEGR